MAKTCNDCVFMHWCGRGCVCKPDARETDEVCDQFWSFEQMEQMEQECIPREEEVIGNVI